MKKTISLCVVFILCLCCFAGCVPKLPAKNYIEFQIADNEHLPVYYAGWVYTGVYETNDENHTYSVYRTHPDGSGKEKITTDVQDNISGFSYGKYHDGWIYWKGGNDSIFRMRPDGSDKTKILDGKENPYIQDYTINGEWIYYRDFFELYRIKLDGSGKQLIADNVESYIFQGQYIFIYSFFTNLNFIYRYDLNNGNIITVVEEERSLLESIDFKFIYNDFLYFTIANKFQRIRFDGSDVQTIVENHDLSKYFAGIFVANKDFIYYVLRYTHTKTTFTLFSDTIYKVRTDGTDNTKLTESYTNYFDGKSCFEIIDDVVYYISYSSFQSVLAHTLEFNRLSPNGESHVIYSNNRLFDAIYCDYFVHENILYLITQQKTA